MLWRIAWRNLWRNRRRSIIILSSIVVATVAMIVQDTLYRGLAFQMLRNQVGLHAGHLQIHTRGYQDNPVLEKAIDRPSRIDSVLRRCSEIVAYSQRAVSYGLVSSAYSSAGVSIVGIEPEKEEQITLISRLVREGRYLGGGDREILISRQLAEKLEVGLGDKLVAMATRLDGTVGSEVFRIVGLFETFDAEFDRAMVYTPLFTTARMLGLGERVCEFVVVLRDAKLASLVRDQLEPLLGPDFEVLTYKDLLPLVVYIIDTFDQFMYIYYAIIGIALIFGVVNTMLMAVFERIREIGVLKAIGMPDHKVFGMVVLEAAILGGLGTGLGSVLGYLFYLPLSRTGINLAAFAQGLSGMGVGSVIYPVFHPGALVNTFLSIPLFATLGAIYPALKAVRFEPIAAMRYV
ncbi:MAG: FtsX-like permease family protein [candidate division KSB1 bacterium]|nr:FtsX-like permease family protein [candidate division KSB1 bacterium]